MSAIYLSSTKKIYPNCVIFNAGLHHPITHVNFDKQDDILDSSCIRFRTKSVKGFRSYMYTIGELQFSYRVHAVSAVGAILPVLVSA